MYECAILKDRRRKKTKKLNTRQRVINNREFRSQSILKDIERKKINKKGKMCKGSKKIDYSIVILYDGQRKKDEIKPKNQQGK